MKHRTVAEVLALQSNGMCCCEAHADNMSCDCLEAAKMHAVRKLPPEKREVLKMIKNYKKNMSKEDWLAFAYAMQEIIR